MGAPGKSKGEDSHEAYVLPCGHVFGKVCVQLWTDHLVAQDMLPDCPTCKTSATHPTCGHPVKILGVPIMWEEEESRPEEGSAIKEASSESVAKALRCFAAAAREVRRDNLSRRLCTIFPKTIPEGGSIAPRCTACRIQQELESLADVASLFGDRHNLDDNEFLAFAAKTGEKQWTLFSKSRGRFSRIVRGCEQYPEALRECRRAQADIKDAWNNCWPSHDIYGIKFGLCVCSWD